MPMLSVLFFHPVLFPSLFLLVVSSIFIILIVYGKRRKPNYSPPSPPWLPIIGNLHQLGSLPHRSLRALSLKHGPLMLLHLGSIPTIVVSSSDVAREIMKTQDANFASRPCSKTINQLVYGGKDMAFAPYGEHWRQVRKISVLHLFSAKSVQSFQVVREEEVASMIEKIASLSSSGQVINLSKMMETLTNDVVCRASVGKKYSTVEDESTDGWNRIHELIRELLEMLGAFHVRDYIPWLAWIDMFTGLNARLENNFRGWDDFLETVIEEQLLLAKEIHGDDSNNNFLNLLLSIEKDDPIGIVLDRDGIKGLLMDMFAAGTDTTAVTMIWAMAELIRHPQLMNKVQEEVRRVIGMKSRICEQDINQMNYLKLVIKKTLRLYPPPFLLPRESLKDTKLDGYDIPAKTRIIVNAWSIGRDPKFWEKPDEFWPERFLDNDVDFRGQDFNFIPFGAGRRICPGSNFSLSTMEFALANLLCHFDWGLPDNMALKDFDMKESMRLMISKKSNLILVAKPHIV